MTSKRSWLFLGFLIAFCGVTSGQKTSYLIAPEKIYLDAADPAYSKVQAGDTLFFASGQKQYLLVKNFQGSPEKPIVFINSGGEVVIDTDHYFGISIQNCRYIKFTGTGDPNQKYGFKVKRVANGSGMGIGDKSSDFEIDHVSIENCKIGGIYAKTDPDCSLSSVRGTFTQFNTSIHDNLIQNVANEGLYIGSTKYFGQTVNCNGSDVLLLPSLLEGVKVYNNIIKYSGWDGIQVSSASKSCQIYNNTILFDSQDEHDAQMSGIIIGGGSKCDCYNNFISNGKGNGIESHGLGGYRIFNNIIVNAGLDYEPNNPSLMKHGIFVTDVSMQSDSSLFIQHNNIINPKSDGIRFSSTKSRNNLIASNVIINPGNFDYYENGNTNYKGTDSYIMFILAGSEVNITNNYFARTANLAGFVNNNQQTPEDFKLGKGSQLIDAALTDKNIRFDFAGATRPSGLKPDIGAFEFDHFNGNRIEFSPLPSSIRLLENPVNEFIGFLSLVEVGQKINLAIYNSSGKIVRHFGKSELNLENQIIRANVSNISTGLYFYSIQLGNTTHSGKFLKK